VRAERKAFLQKPARAAMEGMAFLRQYDPVAGAIQQGKAKLALQFFDRSKDGRVRPV
jgi:hypothetical protein